MVIVTVGADYSGSAVYLGCLYDSKVIATANVDMTHSKAGVDLLRNLFKSYILEHDIDKVWAEESWINGARFPRSGLLLAKTAALLEIAALDVGLSIEFIHPSTWRKAVYGHARPANPKEIARAYVKELFGYETRYKNMHNTAEAILIAHYGSLNE